MSKRGAIQNVLHRGAASEGKKAGLRTGQVWACLKVVALGEARTVLHNGKLGCRGLEAAQSGVLSGHWVLCSTCGFHGPSAAVPSAVTVRKGTIVPEHQGTLGQKQVPRAPFCGRCVPHDLWAGGGTGHDRRGRRLGSRICVVDDTRRHYTQGTVEGARWLGVSLPLTRPRGLVTGQCVPPQGEGAASRVAWRRERELRRVKRRQSYPRAPHCPPAHLRVVLGCPKV